MSCSKLVGKSYYLPREQQLFGTAFYRRRISSLMELGIVNEKQYVLTCLREYVKYGGSLTIADFEVRAATLYNLTVPFHPEPRAKKRFKDDWPKLIARVLLQMNMLPWMLSIGETDGDSVVFTCRDAGITSNCLSPYKDQFTILEDKSRQNKKQKTDEESDDNDSSNHNGNCDVNGDDDSGNSGVFNYLLSQFAENVTRKKHVIKGRVILTTINASHMAVGQGYLKNNPDDVVVGVDLEDGKFVMSLKKLVGGSRHATFLYARDFCANETVKLWQKMREVVPDLTMLLFETTTLLRAAVEGREDVLTYPLLPLEATGRKTALNVLEEVTSPPFDRMMAAALIIINKTQTVECVSGNLADDLTKTIARQQTDSQELKEILTKVAVDGSPNVEDGVRKCLNEIFKL